MFWVFSLDYDEKAEDAIDYEDIDEQYEGPEIQAPTEEDHLLPKKEYFSADVSLASLKPTSVFDDENYDEELEQELEMVDNNFQVQTISGLVSNDLLLIYFLITYMPFFLHNTHSYGLGSSCTKFKSC